MDEEERRETDQDAPPSLADRAFEATVEAGWNATHAVIEAGAGAYRTARDGRDWVEGEVARGVPRVLDRGIELRDQGEQAVARAIPRVIDTGVGAYRAVQDAFGWIAD